MDAKFSRNQRRIWIGCFVSYAAAYVARLNMGAALGSLISGLGITDAQGGLFQTVFALVYAVGQLVNGSIVDRISARRYVALGLLLSGLCNLLFGLMHSYWALVALWGLNGAAQSMLWTPIVKLMAAWFRGARRTRASFGISMTLVLGNVSAWAISGLMASLVGWRLSFIIPAAVVGAAAVAAFALLRDEPGEDEELGEEHPEHRAVHEHRAMPLGDMIIRTGLGMVLVCCVCNGFVRDGIITWGPTIIASLNGGQGMGSTLSSLLIPLLNLMGVLLARKVYGLFGSSARRSVAYLMGASAVLALTLHVASGAMVSCALVLGLCCSATYGINPMLTQLIPMEYEKAGRVGLVAGMSDCFIYLGSSLAGVVTGAISDAAGWPVVFTLWCLVALASMAFAFLSVRGGKRLDDAAEGEAVR
ncbi:MAG: MFS transporter [Clostridia bacterium]|nr:MFS transporter [Clostridia bacterium]